MHNISNLNKSARDQNSLDSQYLSQEDQGLQKYADLQI